MNNNAINPAYPLSNIGTENIDIVSSATEIYPLNEESSNELLAKYFQKKESKITIKDALKEKYDFMKIKIIEQTTKKIIFKGTVVELLTSYVTLGQNIINNGPIIIDDEYLIEI